MIVRLTVKLVNGYEGLVLIVSDYEDEHMCTLLDYHGVRYFGWAKGDVE